MRLLGLVAHMRPRLSCHNMKAPKGSAFCAWALESCRRAGLHAWLLCVGAAMAVGVSCAGTGMRSALDLLAPLLTDAVDFVRQGALIANALVLMQQPESKVCCPQLSQHSNYIAVPMSFSAAVVNTASHGDRNVVPVL